VTNWSVDQTLSGSRPSGSVSGLVGVLTDAVIAAIRPVGLSATSGDGGFVGAVEELEPAVDLAGHPTGAVRGVRHPGCASLRR
jgi:hypothetical protein